MGFLIAMMTIYLGFNAGGFFPGATATVVLAVCLLMVLGVMLVSRPFESFTPALLVPLALVAAFAIWTLVSAAWSGASGRALLEFDRALLYLLVFAFFGMLVPGKRRLEWGLRGFTVAAVTIGLAGWITRVAADVWPISLDVQPERLSFPLTYWNALGLLTSLGLIACIHLSSSRREPRWARVAAATAVPLLASTQLLTYSRAALLLVPLALIAYAAIARPPRLVSTLLATALPVAIAMAASYGADTVSSAEFASSAGISQGHQLALLVIACAALAGGLRWWLGVSLDRRLDEWRPPPVEKRKLAIGFGSAAALLVALAIAFGAPSWANDQYQHFVSGDVVGHHEDPRARLTSAGNNGRVPQWEVALEAFSSSPLHGEGAGTYQLAWARDRPYAFTVLDAHSLYVEVLGELGVVGFLLIAGALVAIFYGLAKRVRGEERQVYAAVLVLGLVWAVHAGIDWDWEMPAVTLWFFALAGLGLSKPADDRLPTGASREPRRMVRIVAAVCIGVLAITPAAISLSQSRLDTAVADFDSGNCPAAIDSALSSLEALKVRPEPYEVIAYCDIRAGSDQLALLQMRNAVDRDPDNWETHYGLAIALAGAGLNPMPELYRARELNPLEATIAEAIEAMRGRTPKERERRAAVARLPV